jgi:hypothetical protein
VENAFDMDGRMAIGGLADGGWWMVDGGLGIAYWQTLLADFFVLVCPWCRIFLHKSCRLHAQITYPHQKHHRQYHQC